VAGILVWLGVLITRYVVRRDSYRSLATIMVVSLILHILCAPAQIFVVHHFYGGVADWTRYTHQGALLASNWRGGHFMLAGTGIRGLLGDGAVSIAGGIIMTVLGPNQLAAFVVAAWLAFVGSVFFYRAFAATFPEADRRRYAVFVLLFPSLLFWTADVGKESIMLFALGLTAYGMALALRNRPLGYVYVVLGGGLALVIRPDELVILVIGFAIAMLVRALVRSDHPRTQHPLSVLAALLFVAAAVVITSLVAAHFVHTLTQSGFSNALTKLSKNNQGTGAGFGSSSVAYSSNPLTYPRDVYSVLFDPLFFSAHGLTQILASLENALVLVVTLLSIPRLRYLPRACLQRPYVLLAAFYSAVFIFAFAALGNLGLITRERTLLLPFLFVALALPIAHTGADRNPWQRGRGRSSGATDGSSGFVPSYEKNSDLVRADWDTVRVAGWIGDPAEVARMEWSASQWKSNS
jgi:hypothetical protein